MATKKRPKRKPVTSVLTGPVTRKVDDDGTITITLPMRTVSEANVGDNRVGKIVAMKRKGVQRMIALHAATMNHAITMLPAIVTLTRKAPRLLDDDNLARSLKAVRDGVADAMGVDDGDVDAVEWLYEQVIAKDYAVEIEIMRRRDGHYGHINRVRELRQLIVQAKRAIRGMR